MKEHLLRLIDHMRWADATVADAFGPVSFETEASHDSGGAIYDAARLFAHIAAAEHLWYARILGATPKYAVWPELTPEASRAVAAEHATAFAELVSRADDAELARVVRYRNSAGREFENSISDIVTHVALHGEHHRGQIARALRAAGREPPYTDFIQFARRAQ